jgi:hypothetical protein
VVAMGGSSGASGRGGAWGASGASGTAGSGGSGGTAGCGGVGVTGAPIAFARDPARQRFPPRLAFSNYDADRAGIASAELPIESPGPVAARLRLASFSPWGSWPASLGDGAESSFVVAIDQFAIARGRTEDTLAIAYPASPSPPAPVPEGLFFAPEVSGGMPADVDSLALAGFESHVVRFVRGARGAHLVGFETGLAGHTAFHLAVRPTVGDPTSRAWLGCATNPISADAIGQERGNGFIFAFSTSRGWDRCTDDDGIDLPANRILVGVMRGSAMHGPRLEIEEPDHVRFVRMVGRPGGAWLIWQYEGINAESPPPVMAMPLDGDGTSFGSAMPVLEGERSRVPPAVASLGSRLAIAWLDERNPTGRSFGMRVVDDEGSVLESSLDLASSMARPELELLESPGGDALLLGWSEGLDANRALDAYVARLCVR